MNQMWSGTVELPFMEQINRGHWLRAGGSPDPCPMSLLLIPPRHIHRTLRILPRLKLEDLALNPCSAAV